MPADRGVARAERPERSALAPLAALFAGFAILIVGNGLQSTLLAVRAGIEGASDGTVGLMMSAYFAGYAAGAWLGPPLVAAAGPIRTFAGLTSVVSAIALTHLLWVDLAAWTAMRLLHGACFAVLVLVVEAWINAATPSRSRGRVLSLYGLVFLAGGAASQPLLNLAPPEGFALFCLVSILASLALVPITLTTVVEPRGLAPRRMGPRALWAASPLGAAGVAASGLAVAAFWGLGPAYAQGLRLSDARLSAFMTAALGGAILTQWPLGWLSDRVDRRLVVAAAALGAAAATAALGLGAWPYPVLLALAAVFGALTLPLYSLCVAHVNDRAPADAVVAVAGGLVLLYGAAAAIGPLAVGLAMEALGPEGLFLALAGVLGALALFGLGRLARRDAVAAEPDKAAYAEAPRTTHVVGDIDPRGEAQAA